MKAIILICISYFIFAKDILLLNSYHSNFKWTQEQVNGILETLKNENINIFIEYMDTKRFRPTKISKLNYLNFLSNKYKLHKFDIIITTDDNALNFVREFKQKNIFKKSKVFFCGVNNLKLQSKLKKNIYTGVFEKKEPLANLKLAKDIIPNLDTIYLIADNSITANKVILEYKKELKNIKNIKFIYLNSKNIEYIKNNLKNNPNSVAFLLVFTSFYKNNKFIHYSKAIKEITSVYNRPFIIHTSIFINLDNVIGGKCVSGFFQGKIVAQKVLKYLNNTSIKDIPFTIKSPNKFYFNDENIKKFNIYIDYKKYNHPIIINKNISFYKLYKKELIAIFLIFILLIIFIFIIYKKNHTINKLNKNLQIDIQKAIEENTKQFQIMQQQSKLAQMGEMIGAIAHQWRQPLNAINTSIQNLEYDFLEGKLQNKSYIDDFIKKNKNIIKFMSRTIDNFRNFFRIDKQKEIFSIKKAIKMVVSILSAQLKYHNIKIKISGKDFKINGYFNEFQQVILNIISNSKDNFLENNIKDPIITILLKDNSIYIQDNGGGINENIIDRIFEPYFTTKEPNKGTGIGLYMSKVIIENNFKGKLEVKNIDNGVEFIIKFNKTI